MEFATFTTSEKYTLPQYHLDYKLADEHCRTSGGHLVAIESHEEMKLLKGFLKKHVASNICKCNVLYPQRRVWVIVQLFILNRYSRAS